MASEALPVRLNVDPKHTGFGEPEALTELGILMMLIFGVTNVVLPGPKLPVLLENHPTPIYSKSKLMLLMPEERGVVYEPLTQFEA